MLKALILLSCILLAPSLSKAEPPSDKPWQVTISAGFGYNDNVPFLDSSLMLTSALIGVTERQSVVGRFTVDGQYDLISTNQHILTVGYNFFVDAYTSSGGVKSFDYLEHTFWGGYQKKLSAKTVASFRLSDRYTTIGGTPLRNSIMLQPALVHQVNDIIMLELNGLWSFNDWKGAPAFGGLAAANLDGEVIEISPVIYITPPNLPFTTHLRYRHGAGRTEGGALDYDENAVSPGIAFPVIWEINMELIYWRIWREFVGLGPMGVASSRTSDIDIFQAIITRPLGSAARWYLDYVHTDAKSNGIAFEYRQNVVTSGVAVTF